MSDFLEIVLYHFGSRDLYQCLGVNRNATECEIRQAYRKSFRLCHPDKNANEDYERATEKSKVLGKIFYYLCDKNVRALYDAGGKFGFKNGKETILVDIGPRSQRNERHFLLTIIMSSHGELWRHFPLAVQTVFSDQTR